MGKILLGIVFGLVLAPLAVFCWLLFGKVPVAVADKPLPAERLITSGPLNARIGRETVKTPPIQVNEDNLIGGAQAYRDQCAVCHGFHSKASQIGGNMFPDAPPLWETHRKGSEAIVGVSDDPPGETYWKVANGIRLTGMPSYKKVLTETQMWQVSLLLANADKPLPPAALAILRGEAPPAPAAAAAPARMK
jgi:mono/diheme cytochrome c family protein